MGDFKNDLKKLIPADIEFSDGFKTATVSKHKFARYYLGAIENHHRGKKFPELLANKNPDAVNLEHILPQNHEDNYPEFSENDKLTYLKRIGNLTLMKTKENNHFKNSSFQVKKKKYKESELWITKSLGELSEWNVKNIEERQAKLSELAVKTWNLNI